MVQVVDGMVVQAANAVAARIIAELGGTGTYLIYERRMLERGFDSEVARNAFVVAGAQIGEGLRVAVL